MIIMQWNTYGYKNKNREAKRMQELEAKQSGDGMSARKERRERKKKNEAWSNKVVQEETRERRKEKKNRKKAWLKTQAQNDEEEQLAKKVKL